MWDSSYLWVSRCLLRRLLGTLSTWVNGSSKFSSRADDLSSCRFLAILIIPSVLHPTEQALWPTRHLLVISKMTLPLLHHLGMSCQVSCYCSFQDLQLGRTVDNFSSLVPWVDNTFRHYELSKYPRCPSTDEWLIKMWYAYTMEFYREKMKSANKWI